MPEYFVDDWDDLVEEENKSNWTEWELWQGWCNKYEWEDIAVQDLEPHDTIVFRDLIFDAVKKGRGKRAKITKFVYVGERLHIAEWIKNADGFMYLKTIYTEGDRPLKPGMKTKRKIRNAARFGLKRFPLGQGAMLTLPNGEPALNSSQKGFEKPVSYPAIPKRKLPAISRFQMKPKNETQ
jgi:hypothetical protein